jgi:hypothetical protein
MDEKKLGIKIKADDGVLKGIYSNNMMISHSSDEFVMDFLNIIPPQGALNARIITTPGHVKRFLKALSENISKYEKKFGEIKEATPPQTPNGFVQ